MSEEWKVNSGTFPIGTHEFIIQDTVKNSIVTTARHAESNRTHKYRRHLHLARDRRFTEELVAWAFDTFKET